MNTELQRQLETLVDEHTLSTVLDNLAMVCFEKAEHLEANWQDKNTAAAWTKAGGCIAKVSSKTEL